MSPSSMDVTDAIQQIATKGDFHIFQPLRWVGLLQLLATCTSPLLRCFKLKSVNIKSTYDGSPFFCQLFQAKDGKDAIVTGGPYALLRHFGHEIVLRFRFRRDNVKGMILIGNSDS